MTWTGRPGPYQAEDGDEQDPEATVLLPIVPFDGPIADMTMLLPVVGSVHDRPGRRGDRAGRRGDHDIRDEPWVPSGHDTHDVGRGPAPQAGVDAPRVPTGRTASQDSPHPVGHAAPP